MSVTDISAQVRAWVMAEAEKQAFGEDFGTDVAWDIVSTPAGPQIAYRVMITCRSPLLGQPPLFAAGPVVSPQPAADEVSRLVTELIRQLRMTSAAVLKSGTTKTS